MSSFRLVPWNSRVSSPSDHGSCISHGIQVVGREVEYLSSQRGACSHEGAISGMTLVDRLVAPPASIVAPWIFCTIGFERLDVPLACEMSAIHVLPAFLADSAAIPLRKHSNLNYRDHLSEQETASRYTCSPISVVVFVCRIHDLPQIHRVIQEWATEMHKAEQRPLKIMVVSVLHGHELVKRQFCISKSTFAILYRGGAVAALILIVIHSSKHFG